MAILKNRFKLVFEEIGKKLIPSFLKLTDVVVDKLLPAIEPFIPILGDFLAGAIEKLIPLLEMMIKGAQNMALLFENEVLPIIKESGPFIEQLGLQIFDAAKEIQAEMMPVIREWIPLMVELFKVVAPLIPPLIDITKNIFILALKIQQMLLPILREFVKFMNKDFGKAIQFIVVDVAILVGTLLDLFNIVSKVLGLGNLKSSQSGNKLKVTDPGDDDVIHLNDFMIRSNGKIIKPHPDDTIMGFKGGMPGGPTFIFNIDQISGTDPEDMMEAFQRELNKKIRI